MNEAEKQAAIAAAQAKIDLAHEAMQEAIAALSAAIGIVVSAPPVLEPAPVTIPASSGPITAVITAVDGKTITIAADAYVVKDKTTVQYPSGRKSHVVGVSLNGTSMAVTTNEMGAIKESDLPGMVGKTITIFDRYPATSTTPAPVAVPPVVETPAPTPTPAPVVPGTSGPIYLAGVNMGALNNNPHVDNSIARIGTHYRDVEQKYIDKYQKLKCKPMRIMIAPERAVDANKGPLRTEYMAQIKGAFDKLAAAGMKGFVDPHSYMRLYTTVPDNYVNSKGYGEARFPDANAPKPGPRKLWIPVGDKDCLMDVDGYADFLNKVTAFLADHPAFMGIGVANEPFGGEVVANYYKNLPKYTAAISAASKTCEIYVGGGEYCTAFQWPIVSDVLKNLPDPYGQIVYEAHQYLDGNLGGGGKWSNRNEYIPIDNFIKMVKPFVEWLKANGKRGIIGEMGFPAGNASAAAATAKGLEYTAANGVPVFQWCAGAGWSPNDVNAVDDDNMTEKDNLEPIKAFFGKSTTAYGKPGA